MYVKQIIHSLFRHSRCKILYIQQFRINIIALNKTLLPYSKIDLLPVLKEGETVDG